MLVEMLTFEGCPHAALTRERLDDALRAENARADVTVVEVASPERAQEVRFLGSPSVRIDGEDVEPGADGRSNYGLMCRQYRTGSTSEGVPSVAMLRLSIRRSLDRETLGSA
jgi:hypothetical protein